MRIAFAFLAVLSASLPARADPLPYSAVAVNTPYTGCVEGRAIRIVNGAPSCSSTLPPTLTACAGGTIDATATDFIGQVSLPAGLTSCTIVMTKLYAANFICIAQGQGGSNVALGQPVIGNNGTFSTLVVPLTLNIAATKFAYICGPG